MKFVRKSMKRHEKPNFIVTDKLRSYRTAMTIIENADRQQTGRSVNNGAENSYLPFRRRERAMLKFRSRPTLQKLAYVKASIENHFDQERHFY